MLKRDRVDLSGVGSICRLLDRQRVSEKCSILDSGGSSLRLETQRLELFPDFGGKARRLEPFEPILGSFFTSLRNSYPDFCIKNTEKNRINPNLSVFFICIM
jgi:hypothetical protein